MKLVCRTELMTSKMVEDRNPAQDMIDISRNVLHENASYDKDVMEIKLTDTVVSSDYGDNFVKYVCIDDRHRKSSEGRTVEEKSSPNFGCLTTDANSDPIHKRKNKARKSAHKLKPEIILPVHFAPNGNNEKQSSSGEEHDLEEKVIATKTAGDVSEKKISLEDLLRLESEEESQHKGAISTKSSENHISPPLHIDAAGQVFVNGCHGFEAIASPTSDLDNTSITMKNEANDCSAMPSSEHDATSAFDARGPNQVNHHNPVVVHGLQDQEDTCKPECSISAIADAEPICAFEKTEPRVAAPSSTSSDIQPSKNDQTESLPSEAITDAMDKTAVASSSSANIEDPSGANRENHAHDFNNGDEENRVDTMNIDTVGSTSTQAQKDNTDEQAVTDSAKVTSRTGNGYLFEPDLYGPSIMAATVSNSGHIAYSGNISIRSDSSTTSTRSFAFPVLQREWIVSSPMRMAKGKRRRRSWRKGLLCCQF